MSGRYAMDANLNVALWRPLNPSAISSVCYDPLNVYSITSSSETIQSTASDTYFISTYVGYCYIELKRFFCNVRICLLFEMIIKIKTRPTLSQALQGHLNE